MIAGGRLSHHHRRRWPRVRECRSEAEQSERDQQQHCDDQVEESGRRQAEESHRSAPQRTATGASARYGRCKQMPSGWTPVAPYKQARRKALTVHHRSGGAARWRCPRSTRQHRLCTRRRADLLVRSTSGSTGYNGGLGTTQPRPWSRLRDDRRRRLRRHRAASANDPRSRPGCPTSLDTPDRQSVGRRWVCGLALICAERTRQRGREFCLVIEMINEKSSGSMRLRRTVQKDGGPAKGRPPSLVISGSKVRVLDGPTTPTGTSRTPEVPLILETALIHLVVSPSSDPRPARGPGRARGRLHCMKGQRSCRSVRPVRTR